MNFKPLFPLLLIVIGVLSSGCAKHELVKTDQANTPIPSATSIRSSDSMITDAARPNVEETAQPLPQNNTSKTEASTEDVAQQRQYGNKLEKVYFSFDSYALSPKAREALTANADILLHRVKTRVRIEGNCDEVGSDEYNLALGEKRARTALQYLLALGISSERLEVISFGKEKPADFGHDETARSRNRRDEFVIISE